MHAVEPCPNEIDPAGHGRHDDCPLLGWKSPEPHKKQELLPLAPWEEPGVHATHVAVAVEKRLPAPHDAQKYVPALALNAPTEPEAQQRGPPGALYVSEVM